VLVAKQALDRGQSVARFQQVGGEGVAQGMDAALLADAGAQFRGRVDPLGHGDIDRARARAIGEEPDARRRGLPVRAPLLEQPRGERDVAVLGAFPLLDAHRHPVGIEVRDLQGNRLTHAQAGGVGGRQQEAMTDVRAGVEHPPDLLAAEDLRQRLRLLGGGDVEVAARVAQRHVVEEAEGMGGLTARAPGQLADLDQVGEIGLDFVVGELVRGALVMLRQAYDGGHLRLVGARGEAAQGHVTDHAGTEFAHGTPPGVKGWDEIDLEGIVSRRTSTVEPARRCGCTRSERAGRDGDEVGSNLPRQRFSSTRSRLNCVI
jgi:hypothetical protein